MRRLSVDPNKVWSWHPSKRFDESIPWENIPVPVFEIPPEHKNSDHDFIIIDGSRRRLRAISMRSDLFVACYEYGEEIDIERNGLAPFEHHDDPKLYERLLKAYLLRDKLPELMKSRQQPKATSPSTEPRATR
jgi:hypothetical protein